MELRNSYEEIAKRGAVLVAVSKEPLWISVHLAKELRLPFPLLSDKDYSVIKMYGVYDRVNNYAIPSIFIFDREGNLRYFKAGKNLWDRIPPKKIIEILDSL